jgi:single-strand DNA-binding protein
MFQQVILVGNLGNDPELRYTPSGQPVTSFSLATNRVWVDANGQRQTKTIWFKVTCWRKLAETVSQHLTKGAKVMVVGEIEEQRVFTDKDGNQRASLEVTAQTVKFLDGKPQGDGNHRLPESLTELEEIPF